MVPRACMLNGGSICSHRAVGIATFHRPRPICVGARHGAVRTGIVRSRLRHRLWHGSPILRLVGARVLVSAVVCSFATVRTAVNHAHLYVGCMLRAVPCGEEVDEEGQDVKGENEGYDPFEHCRDVLPVFEVGCYEHSG